jgi:hypothetical protein
MRTTCKKNVATNTSAPADEVGDKIALTRPDKVPATLGMFDSLAANKIITMRMIQSTMNATNLSQNPAGFRSRFVRRGSTK